MGQSICAVDDASIAKIRQWITQVPGEAPVVTYGRAEEASALAHRFETLPHESTADLVHQIIEIVTEFEQRNGLPVAQQALHYFLAHWPQAFELGLKLPRHALTIQQKPPSMQK